MHVNFLFFLVMVLRYMSLQDKLYVSKISPFLLFHGWFVALVLRMIDPIIVIFEANFQFE